MLLVSQTRGGPDHLLPWSDGAMLLAVLRAVPLASISKDTQYYQISLPSKKLRQWRYKNNNMLREGRGVEWGWRIKRVEWREWDNNNNKLSS